MRHFRTRSGPFVERPFYTTEEIERICTDELRRVDLYPVTPQPVRIDRFIEKRFGVSHEYDDLPPGILGYTTFGKDGVKSVIISRGLEDENTRSSERRVRSTLAHEAGHGLLHAHLFVLSGQSALFPEGMSATPRVLCRDERSDSPPKVYRGDWWEFQANRAIGALLLPRQLAVIAVEEYLTPTGGLGVKSLSSVNRMGATSHLAEVFDVNPVVASIRLSEFFPGDIDAQGML